MNASSQLIGLSRGSNCAMLSSILTTGLVLGLMSFSSPARANMCDGAFVRVDKSPYELDLRVNPVNYDPLVKQAVQRSLYPDFKTLTDLIPLELSGAELRALRRSTAEVRRHGWGLRRLRHRHFSLSINVCYVRAVSWVRK